MPRVARRRDPETPHHIMCRSISEIQLFRSEDDKVKYLQLMALYCKKFECNILSYCLMDTHVHIQLDPQGCDISKFMHGLNLCYAQYFNRKYKRHGHVFQGRFINKVIDVDEYNLVVSAYIHNNAKDLPDFRDWFILITFLLMEYILETIKMTMDCLIQILFYPNLAIALKQLEFSMPNSLPAVITLPKKTNNLK